MYNFIVGPMREKSKYLKMNWSTREFSLRLFILRKYVFQTF